MENDFLKHLSTSQVREIVDYMERKTVAAGTYIIREGDTGEDSKSRAKDTFKRHRCARV
jgi:hypothetical protein